MVSLFHLFDPQKWSKLRKKAHFRDPFFEIAPASSHPTSPRVHRVRKRGPTRGPFRFLEGSKGSIKAGNVQVFVRPWSFDKWLPALDAALASFSPLEVARRIATSRALPVFTIRLEAYQNSGVGHASRPRHCHRSQPRLGDYRTGVRLWLSRANQCARLGVGERL